MASFFTTSPSDISSSSSSSSPDVTKDQFNAFHKIDRTFYARLVLVLNRDMYQSLEVFCFLYWVEQIGYGRNFIAYLVSLPVSYVDVIANEVVVCLGNMRNQFFSSAFFDDDLSVIPMLHRLTGGKVNLRSLHQDRESILEGIGKNLTDICYRAFEDICARVERYHKERVMALEREKVMEGMKQIRLSVQQEAAARFDYHQRTNTRLSVQQDRALAPSGSSVQQERALALPGSSVQQERVLALPAPPRWSVQQERALALPAPPGSSVQQERVLALPAPPRLSVQQERVYALPAPPRLSVQQERVLALHAPAPAPAPFVEDVTPIIPVVESEVVAEAEVEEVEADDRTVFLTFSKGYPLSESDVRNYFTRRFGDVIEVIEMQEVEANEQPLYARMVLRSQWAWKLEEIVTPRNRNKFTIDGKHVWTRKYIRKIAPGVAFSSYYY